MNGDLRRVINDNTTHGYCDNLNGFGIKSPDWVGEDWYRFHDYSKMPDHTVSGPACGSSHPVYILGNRDSDLLNIPD